MTVVLPPLSPAARDRQQQRGSFTVNDTARRVPKYAWLAIPTFLVSMSPPEGIGSVVNSPAHHIIGCLLAAESVKARLTCCGIELPRVKAPDIRHDEAARNGRRDAREAGIAQRERAPRGLHNNANGNQYYQ